MNPSAAVALRFDGGEGGGEGNSREQHYTKQCAGIRRGSMSAAINIHKGNFTTHLMT